VGATVGVVTSLGSGPSAPDPWPQGAWDQAEVILSPPAPLDEVAQRSQLILLSLPDGELRQALSSLGGFIGRKKVIVSTCPVVPLRLMRSLIGDGPALFRAVIPWGTHAGEGVAALAADPGTAPEAVRVVEDALAWIGAVEVMSEETLDAVTALGLGGAAFLCAAVQGLEEGAVREGLPRATARSLAHQTALATALLLRDHPGSPADLKDQVTSPGGTTVAALSILEDTAVRGAFLRAVQRSAGGVRARRYAASPGVIE